MEESVPSASLLVHLSPRSDTINSHEEQFFRLDDLEQNADVMEYILKNLFFCYTEMWVRVIWVRAVVDYTIHI